MNQMESHDAPAPAAFHCPAGCTMGIWHDPAEPVWVVYSADQIVGSRVYAAKRTETLSGEDFGEMVRLLMKIDAERHARDAVA